jgi:hypothetical protein
MMSYRIIVAAYLFPAVACAGPVGVGDGVHGISVFNGPTGFTISGHVPGGSQSVSVGPGPGSASAIASSFGTFGALSSTGAAVLSAPSGTVSGAFGIGTISSANSNAGN